MYIHADLHESGDNESKRGEKSSSNHFPQGSKLVIGVDRLTFIR